MRVLIIQGHPDRCAWHFCHALADAYAEGARSAGHAVEWIDIGMLDFAFLRSQEEWQHARLPPALADAQAAITRADHLVIIYPLWLGGMPAALKGFLEQVMRPGFAVPADRPSLRAKLLAGRSARVVVTMGMPAVVYRWYFFAHGLRLLKRNILGLIGIAPVRDAVVGSVENLTRKQRIVWLRRLRSWGQAAV
ncbi:NAD(P)H-dependent oxidoreductase [Variovorax rhizosphaerae]|uniref:NAD(P)H-dependent oxidoreductase n=1 Tax=Variovorax rhizosphaerae TaxID=1836200 RepID=A0ABU8WT04_9BURK